MAQTASSALSSLVTFDVQQQALKNLRVSLVYANRDWSEQGSLMPGTDTARFAFMPDMSIAATPLTEGTTPTAVALTFTNVDVTVAQYGNLVDITDVAKVKSPLAIIAEASDRVSRNAQDTIDQITRDAIATGGTAFYEGGAANRAALASGNTMKGSDLRKLYFTMRKNKIPQDAQGHYTLILGAEQGFDLKADTTASSGIIPTLAYTTPGIVREGEIEAFEGFRIIIAQNPPTFSSTVTVTAGFAFGPVHGWGVADLQSLNVYHVAAGGDHNDPLAQHELLGWKIMFGVAVLANNRFYRLESATTAL